jgi:hypothetical protein
VAGEQKFGSLLISTIHSTFSNPWIFRLHHDSITAIRSHRPQYWVLNRVQWFGPQTVRRPCRLLLPVAVSSHCIVPRLCLEIVSVHTVSVAKTYLPLQLEKDIPPTLVSYRTRAAEVQYPRLSTTARAVSIFFHSNKLCSPPLTSGSKKPSGRSAPCSGCVEIVDLRSVRRRMLLAGKSRQNLFGHTIHPSHTKSPVAYSLLYLVPWVDKWFLLRFSCITC